MTQHDLRRLHAVVPADFRASSMPQLIRVPMGYLDAGLLGLGDSVVDCLP